MGTLKIQYIFTLDDNEKESFDLEIDEQSIEIVNNKTGKLPKWTELTFHQCSHCPLKPDSTPHCPVAVSLVDVLKRFDKIISCDDMKLEVITEGRKTSFNTTAQRAISSIVGLLFATSGCPHTSFLKPMARFHMPIASVEETMFRATGMYLLSQYFLKQEGKKVDFEFEGLKKIYQNLHLLNSYIIERIRGSIHTDSMVNAIVLLDMFTNLIPKIINNQLEDIRDLFSHYVKDYDDHIKQFSNYKD